MGSGMVPFERAVNDVNDVGDVNDPWPLHHSILRTGLGGGVATGKVVLDNPLGLGSKTS